VRLTNMDMEWICATCGIAVRWQPTIIDTKVFCCLGCALGGPCTCDYDRLPRESDHSAIVVRRHVRLSICTKIIHLEKEE